MGGAPDAVLPDGAAVPVHAATRTTRARGPASRRRVCMGGRRAHPAGSSALSMAGVVIGPRDMARLGSVSSLRRASRSGADGPPPRPELGVLREEVAELVRARQHHPLRERVDLELDRRAVRQQDAALGQVDRQRGLGVGLQQREQPGVGRRIDDDRQDARSSGCCCGRCRRRTWRGWPGRPRPRAPTARARATSRPRSCRRRAGSGGRPSPGWSRMNGGSLSDPSSLKRQSRKRASARPALSVILR